MRTQKCKAKEMLSLCNKLCDSGMILNYNYNAPDEVCLSDIKKNTDKTVTKQICTAGSSDISHGVACRAGLSPDEETESEDSIVIHNCNSGKWVARIIQTYGMK